MKVPKSVVVVLTTLTFLFTSSSEVLLVKTLNNSFGVRAGDGGS